MKGGAEKETDVCSLKTVDISGCSNEEAKGTAPKSLIRLSSKFNCKN